MTQLVDSHIQIEKVSKSYHLGKTEIPVLRNISFSVDHGEFVGIMGPSGSGKTTLLSIIAALQSPSSGDIIFDSKVKMSLMGQSALTRFRLENIGLIFQSHNLFEALTAYENIEAPLLLLPRTKTSRNSKDRREIVQDLMERLEITEQAGHLISELSGGQKQRVAVGRALATNPSLVIADEPTGSLDTMTGRHVVDILRSLSKENQKTVLMVTHDPSYATGFDRVLSLRSGVLTQVSHPESEEAIFFGQKNDS
ncbi:MAG TPA: ABC transporter ATP-binding protein [Candidatus Hodarchaeales archaeon]|nr:ABC transporter ATP-binding protein [Candidatus Hodarchaeales archaeon]